MHWIIHFLYKPIGENVTVEKKSQCVDGKLQLAACTRESKRPKGDASFLCPNTDRHERETLL